MLENGANVNARDSENKTACDLVPEIGIRAKIEREELALKIYF